MRELLFKYDYVEQGLNPNQYTSNPILIKPDKEGINEFNNIYKTLLDSNLDTLQRTPSGGIVKHINNTYCWDIRHSPSGGIITVYAYGNLWVFKLGRWGTTKRDISPYKAFKMFEDECFENGIILSSYAIDNGKEVKEEIPKPRIYIPEKFRDVVLENVHHIDFHSSYPAGLANTHPEFRPIIEKFYNGRKEHPEYKGVLNYTIGMMQSLNVKPISAKYAHLSKDAIEDNNNRIDTMTRNLILSHREVIGYNTDGIWYQGEIYHDENEGTKLGQWSNDHINCTFRAKSSGSYEFIEDGNYTPVVRGFTNLDNEIPRNEWKWGYIYKSDVNVLDWNDKEGFVDNVL